MREFCYRLRAQRLGAHLVERGSTKPRLNYVQFYVRSLGNVASGTNSAILTPIEI